MNHTDAKELWDRWTRSHSDFPVPTLAFQRAVGRFWRNEKAAQSLPFIKSWEIVASLIPDADSDPLLSKLEAGSVTLPADCLIPDSQLFIVSGPVPDSLVAYLVQTKETGSMPALLDAFVGNSRHWLTDIFATIDSASLRSTLMEGNWDLPALRRISASSYKILRDLMNFTEYTRIINDEMPSPQLFELGEYLENTQALVSAMAKERSVEVVYSLPDGPVYLEGNLKRLELAVINLLSNAVRFAPIGSRISLSLEIQECQAVIRVEDHGPGIPENLLDKIFEPGFSYHPSGEISLGIGLPLSKLIAQNEGGTLTVSNTGHGAQAVLTVPLASLTPDKPLSLAQEPTHFYPVNDRFSPIYIGLSDLL